MKKMMKMLMGVSCALLAGTVMAEDNAEPAWLLITPQVTMRPNKYGDDVPEITGYLTNGYYQVRNAVQDAKSGSTILLARDRSSDVGESPVFIHEDKIVAIDLNGHSLSPGNYQGGWPIIFQNPSNAVLSIANGSISGDLQFYTQDNTGTGSVVLGPDLVTDGNLNAYKGAGAVKGIEKVILEGGFKSTRTAAFDTEAQFLAMRGAKFAYPHNSPDEPESDRLKFPSPDLQLVFRDDEGVYVVSEPELDNRWAYDLSSWMDDIPTNTPIYKICLPASHDSGMTRKNLEGISVGGVFRKLIISVDMYATQYLDIKGQLASGTRVFDIRVCHSTGGNDFRTYHGMSASSAIAGMYGERLDDILDAVEDFLAATERGNKNEFVIFELSHPGENEWYKKISRQQTQIDVLEYIKNHKVGKRLFKYKEGDSRKRLNDYTLGDVRGKLILLLNAENPSENDKKEGFDMRPLVDPKIGIWGYGTEGDWHFTMKDGYYCLYDDYANRGNVEEVSEKQHAHWARHTTERIKQESKGGKTTAFCLDWTMTFNHTEDAILKNLWVWLLGVLALAGVIAAIVIGAVATGPVALPVVLVLLGSLSPLITYWRFLECGHGIKDMANEINSKLGSTLSESMAEIDSQSHTNKYLKPSMISIDYVSSALNMRIIDLNADLCKYAAEVVRPDGTVDRKYEKLNDAFGSKLLEEPNNGCTVRLLRSESPDDENGFIVQADRYVRLDLNGKTLRSAGRFEESNKPLLSNSGHLEVFNSKPETGGFGGARRGTTPGYGSMVRNYGDLILKGVNFVDAQCHNGIGKNSLIHNDGQTVVLDEVTISPTCSCQYAITQDNGAMYLTNCTVSAKMSEGPISGEGGAIEMFGGCLNRGIHRMPVLKNSCVFTLRKGEIKGFYDVKGSDGYYPLTVEDGAQLVIHDGFVGAYEGKPSIFTVQSGGTVQVYGGCFAKDVPQGYIARGRTCLKTDAFPDYRYEIVPCGPGGKPEVAMIAETEVRYPTVQAAVDAVKAAGVRQTVELLCNTHPTETVAIDSKTALTLDLHGYSLMKRGTESPVICNYGGLTLTDSATNSLGSVSAFASKSPVASEQGGIIYNAGTLFVEGGEIRNGLAVKGGGIYNEENGLCLVESGVLADCRATESGGGVFNCGRLVIRGGEIATCAADKSGGGIWNAGDLKVLDGAICACTAPVGGGLANGRNAALFGGIIADNVATTGPGAGIYADRQTETMICGAWVKDYMSVGSAHSGTARVRIFEGYFGDSPRATWLDNASVLTVNVDPETRADYPYAVLQKAVAEVDGKPYKTLDEALEQTTNSEKTVRLLSHVRNTDTVLPASCNAVLDLAGHWIMGCDAALTLQSSSRLRIVDSVGGGTVNCLFATNSARACSIRNAGICRIEGGRYADAIDNSNSLSIRAGLFGQDPDNEWVDSRSGKEPNEDELTRYEYPFAVVAKENASRAEEPTNLLPLQEALDGDDLTGESLRTVHLAEDSDLVSVSVRKGHRAVLDLRGHRLHGVAHQPVITVEPGASLTIVDSVGGGLILKEDVNRTDPELVGGIVNYGDLTLAGGTISNCCGRIYGGVYNAPGATFVMSGGAIAGCGTTGTDYESAPGVLNAGTFWMTGGEIAGCRSAGGTMAVCNLTGAEFNQLGGTISDGFNGAGGTLDRSHVCYVWNQGHYALVDGQVRESDNRQTGYWRECICNALDGPLPSGSFVQLWGTVVAPAGHSRDNAISYLGGQDDTRLFRISNGMIDGQVEWVHPGGAVFTGAVSGGFFTTNSFLRIAIDRDFCTCETNTDAATKQEYAWRVVPQYEAEVLDAMGEVIGHCTLQQGLDCRDDQGVRLRLVTDVKDCVVCSNAAPVTLDLNGFAITGTGKTFADGFARPVIRNEGTLTVFDSSTNHVGFISMPSDGTVEEGGAICNYGTLCVSNAVIFGTRARRGGGVFNAVGATADFDKVSLTGCRATEATSGDLICNEGVLTLTDCTLEAWPDARNPCEVRRGLAIASRKTSHTQIVNTKVRGQFTAEELDGGSVPVAITSGLFDEEPLRDWVVEPSVCQRNGNEETRYAYRWSVDRGLKVKVSPHGEAISRMCMDSLYVSFGDGDFKRVWWTGGSGAWETFSDIPRDAEITLRAYCKSGDIGFWIVEKTIPLSSFPRDNDFVSVIASLDLFFDAAIEEELFTTVSDALAAATGRVVTLFHDVTGCGHRLPAGKRAVLDLNGYVLRGDGTNSVIVNEGELTLRDSSASGAGMVVRSGDRFPQSGGGVSNFGSFTLESGVIAGCRAVSQGGGIYGSDRSVTYIRGGEIFGCWAEKGPSIYSLGRVEVSDGAICERMAFGKLPPNSGDPESAWRGASVFVTGGIFGVYPQPPDLGESWIASGAEVGLNDDAETKDSYPYRVVNTLACDPIYDVVRVDQAYFTTNSTVLAANRIYRFVSDVTLIGSKTNSTLASALSVTGGTTVVYIDAGVTVALTGSVANVRGDYYSGAGLRVPEHATLIVTGEGTLLAKGSDSMNGEGGRDADEYASSPGDGGEGGAGGAAAIGGVGGIGGAGEYPRYDLLAEAGQPGEGMGRVVLLGNVRVSARSCSTAAQGGERGKGNYGVESEYVGGGGGGGSGGVPAYAIGGGAGGGGGGSGGDPDGDTAGAGGFGGSFVGNDGDGEDGGYDPGAGGACGGDGEFYIGDLVSLDCNHLDGGTNRTGRTLNRHDALRRRITVKTESDFELGTFEAFVGEPLPELNPDIIKAWGDCSGLYCHRIIGDSDEKWYEADGTPCKSVCEVDYLGDVTLYFRLDLEETVAIIEDETLGTLRFPTLAAAVAAAKYGSTIIVVGDVTGESVKIPSGMTVRIGSNGQFRPPKAEDLLHDYYKVITNFEGSKVVGYEYLLDADKVAPRVGDDSESGTPWLEFVVDEKTGLGTSAIINIVNAYEDLYYGIDSGTSPTELNPPATWVPAFERGSLRLEVPADESGCFYRVRATDHVGGTMPDGSGYRLMAE